MFTRTNNERMSFPFEVFEFADQGSKMKQVMSFYCSVIFAKFIEDYVCAYFDTR